MILHQERKGFQGNENADVRTVLFPSCGSGMMVEVQRSFLHEMERDTNDNHLA